MKSHAERRIMKRMDREARGIFSSSDSNSSISTTIVDGVLRVTMDFFQHRYYRLNKILMTLIGHWPYQSTGMRRAFLAVSIFLGSNQIVPLFMALAKYRNDRKIVMDCAPPLIFGLVYLTKSIGFVVHWQKTVKLLNRIRTDWHKWAEDREVNILHQYAEQGRKMTIGYLAMGITSQSVFMTQPTIPKIIAIFMKNATEPGQFPYPVDYYHLDIQKYYFYIIAYSYISIFATMLVIATHSIMLICYTQHVCSIFAALGHKLKWLGNNFTSVETEETRYIQDKRDIVLIATCIDRHNDAIEYVDLITASYTRTFFFTVGFGAIFLNALGIQILVRLYDPQSTIRFVILVLGVVLYFYVECSISETVMDHSISIQVYIQSSQWYTLSLEAQKLLQFMTMRCSIPCQFTAGKIMVMSMKNFWMTIKTTLSYLTLVRSMQGL